MLLICSAPVTSPSPLQLFPFLSAPFLPFLLFPLALLFPSSPLHFIPFPGSSSPLPPLFSPLVLPSISFPALYSISFCLFCLIFCFFVFIRFPVPFRSFPCLSLISYVFLSFSYILLTTFDCLLYRPPLDAPLPLPSPPFPSLPHPLSFIGFPFPPAPFPSSLLFTIQISFLLFPFFHFFCFAHCR